MNVCICYKFLEKHPYFFGNGSGKCREKLVHPNAHFIGTIHPLANGIFALAEKAMAKQDFKDVAYFEPFSIIQKISSSIYPKEVNLIQTCGGVLKYNQQRRFRFPNTDEVYKIW